MIGIYRMISPNGSVYIGQSVNITQRKSVYNTAKCIGQTRLYRSLKKYGFDAHGFEVICEFPNDIDRSVLDNYEIFCISQYKEAGIDLLNLRPGGTQYGTNTAETRNKISKTLKAKNIKPPSRLGMPISPEHKERFINARRGSTNSPEHIAAIIRSNNSRTAEYNAYLGSLNCKRWTITTHENNLIGVFGSLKEAALYTGLSAKKISNIKNGGKGSHKYWYLNIKAE